MIYFAYLSTFIDVILRFCKVKNSWFSLKLKEIILIMKAVRKTMEEVLGERMASLLEKEKLAKTEIEQKIYSEAIVHCNQDLERAKRSSRIRRFRRVVGLVFIITIVFLTWKLLDKNTGSGFEGGPSIGSVVHENANPVAN